MIQQLQTQTDLFQQLAVEDPIVLCAADENYIMPLAVTLYSAAERLGSGRHLHVILLDGGITENSRGRLKETLANLPITIHWLTPDKSIVEDLGISHHITHTAYLRLLAAKLLPDSIKKVIYLDSDVLVEGDLSELWKYDLDDQYCLAVIDISCPYVNAYEAARERPKLYDSLPYLNAICPIPNWRQLKLDGAAPYFNSGVMVLNLERWRHENIEQQLLACLRDNKQFVWCWDQYALNVVFHEQWKPLPGHWNQGAHAFAYPENCSPVAEDELETLLHEPSVIHFTTEFKPWKAELFHPLRDRFFEVLDQTAWTGWRPSPEPFSWKRWWDLKAIRMIRFCQVHFRKLRRTLR